MDRSGPRSSQKRPKNQTGPDFKTLLEALLLPSRQGGAVGLVSSGGGVSYWCKGKKRQGVVGQILSKSHQTIEGSTCRHQPPQVQVLMQMITVSSIILNNESAKETKLLCHMIL